MVGKSCTAQKRANRFFPRACGPKSLCSEAGMREGSLSFTTCWTTAYSVSSGAPSVTARYPTRWPPSEPSEATNNVSAKQSTPTDTRKRTGRLSARMQYTPN